MAVYLFFKNKDLKSFRINHENLIPFSRYISRDTAFSNHQLGNNAGEIFLEK